MNRWAGLAIGILLTTALLACTGRHGTEPDTPPARPFDAITDEQLESSMGRLASGVARIEMIFSDPVSVRETHRLDIIRILDEMIVAADALAPTDVSAHHPGLEHDLTRFREKLAIARRSAAMKPPRYYLVGNLAGTCLACHGGR